MSIPRIYLYNFQSIINKEFKPYSVYILYQPEQSNTFILLLRLYYYNTNPIQQYTIKWRF